MVEAVTKDNEAMNLPANYRFRFGSPRQQLNLFGNHLDQRIGHKYPKMLTLKI
jgi:hypothetical protein